MDNEEKRVEIKQILFKIEKCNTFLTASQIEA